MTAKVFIMVLACLTSVLGFNKTALTDDCFKGRLLSATVTLACTTSRGLTVQMIKSSNKIFYCVKFEKKSGDVSAFDVLTFDLVDDDYELNYTGANVISSDAKKPEFKLYDTRLKSFYKGKFVFSSENDNFDIKSVLINDEEQVCLAKNKQVWPIRTESVEVTTRKIPATTTFKSSRPTEQTFNSCGQIKLMENIGGFASLPSWPGQFPWVVAIYRYYNDEEESYYKCSGTLIGSSIVLTSGNCLLEDGLLLKSNDLQVYVSPFSLSAKKKKSRIYDIAELIVNEYFDFHLENNIAAVKLTTSIEFNDYVQPICLPNHGHLVLGKLGKFAGFGKSSSTQPPKTDLLTEAEYQITKIDSQTFEAENTSGNSRVSDIGGGFFFNDTNRWILDGIMSRKSNDPKVFVFTTVKFHLNWIENLNKP